VGFSFEVLLGWEDLVNFASSWVGAKTPENMSLEIGCLEMCVANIKEKRGRKKREKKKIPSLKTV